MFLGRFASLLPRYGRFFSSNTWHDLSKAIGEVNKEIESVFGEPLGSSALADSVETNATNNDFQDSQFIPNNNAEISSSPGLTHIGSKGEAQMVDISHKDATKRVAIASCKVILGKDVFQLVSDDLMGKGDVLGVAKLAGICGAKQTSNLIPLCHNINLTRVRVNLKMNPVDYSVEIEGETASSGKTGVEMEAMTAVSIAGLTVYDMCKAASKDICITNIRLENKSGGKSGDWSRKK